MPQTNFINRAIVLNSRPIGPPTSQNFRLEETSIPTVSTGQVLLRTQYLSLDPYMRGRMSDGPSYAASMSIGDVMVGGTVSRIEVSSHPDYKVGDMVLGYCGWQDYAASDGKGLTKLNIDKHHPSLALGVLGMPGFTAYMGIVGYWATQIW